MAQPKGMSDYVAHKYSNAGAVDELKVNVPTTKGGTRPNTPALRAKDNRIVTIAPSGDRRQLDRHEEKPFHATDTSTLSRESTAGTTKQQEQAHSPRRPGSQTAVPETQVPQENDDNYEEVDYFEEVTDHDTDGEGIPNDPLRRKADGQAKNQKQPQPDERILPTITGDSYPPTTSGGLSNAELDTHHSQDVGQTHIQSAKVLPTRGHGTRLPNVSYRENQPRSADGHPVGPIRTDASIPQNIPERPDDFLYVVGAGFKYTTRSQMRSNVSRLNGPQQVPAHQQLPFHQPHHAHALNKSTRVETAPQSQISDMPLVQEPERRKTAYEHRNRSAEPHQAQSPRQHKAQPTRNEPDTQQKNPELPVTGSHPPFAGQGPPLEANRPSNHTTAAGGFVSELARENVAHVQSSHGEQRLQKQPQVSYDRQPDRQTPYEQQRHESDPYEIEVEGNRSDLDIEGETLYNMKFDSLKTADFDKDPSHGPFTWADKQNESKNLAQKLVLVKDMAPEEQNKFFFDLTIEQWEDAGEWFIQQFGQVMQKLRTCRREKRKFAHEYEALVEKRHHAVSEKRELTLSALRAMRESGGKVLQSTPAKVKKSR